MLPGQMHGWTIREHCAQFNFRDTVSLEASSRPTQIVMDANHTAWRRVQDREQWQWTAMLQHGACPWWWWWWLALTDRSHHNWLLICSWEIILHTYLLTRHISNPNVVKAVEPEFCSFMFVLARAGFCVCLCYFVSVFLVFGTSAIDCLERRLQNELLCVEWGVKRYWLNLSQFW